MICSELTKDFVEQNFVQRDSNTTASLLHEYLLMMAICNSVTPNEKAHAGFISNSPDEHALVLGAKHLGTGFIITSPFHTNKSRGFFDLCGMNDCGFYPNWYCTSFYEPHCSVWSYNVCTFLLQGCFHRKFEIATKLTNFECKFWHPKFEIFFRYVENDCLIWT